MDYAAIEVAIGLGLVYLILSMICSLVQETISAQLSMRSKTLEDGVRNLLGDGKITIAGTAIDLHEAVFQHPLIKALSPKNGKPAYIPSRTFARALLDLVHGAAGTDGTPEKLAAALATLPDGDLKRALTALAQDGFDGVHAARRNIERWFDDAMDRVGGWYKRKAQKILLLIGLAVAVALNVDTIQIARTLWRDPVLRQTLVERADKTTADGNVMSAESITTLRGELEVLDLPLGWPPAWSGTSGPSLLGALLVALVGWILTAAAISLGAPFWFDMINKLLNVRSSGARPEQADARAAQQPPAGPATGAT